VKKKRRKVIGILMIRCGITGRRRTKKYRGKVERIITMSCEIMERRRVKKGREWSQEE
jgi:hypothetical protein